MDSAEETKIDSPEKGKDDGVAADMNFYKRDWMMYFPAVLIYAVVSLLALVAQSLGVIGSTAHSVLILLSIVPAVITEIVWRQRGMRFDVYMLNWILPDSSPFKRRLAEQIKIYEQGRKQLKQRWRNG